MDIVISDHARYEIVRRQLSEELVRLVAEYPQQVVQLKKKRKVCQGKYYESQYTDTHEEREMLLRVVCEERRNVLFVITAYKTSKVDKYWSKED